MNHRLEHVFKFFEEILPHKYSSRELRTTQVHMAVKIASILAPWSRTKTLLIHAPVGTGKTFGALVPALYDISSGQNKRLIYSTSSLNLQAQLKNDELRLLRSLGEVSDFIVAKGMTHYMCLKRLQVAHIHEKEKQDLRSYVLSTIEGDRVGFEQDYYSLSDEIWNQLNLQNQGDCTFCQDRSICPTYNHRRKFNDPNYSVVVTNHNQLIQSVLNHFEDRKPILDYSNPGGIIVIDEGHDLEDCVLGQLSEKLKLSQLFEATKLLTGQVRNTATEQLNIVRSEMKKLKYELDTTKGRHAIPDSCNNALAIVLKLYHEAITEKESKGFDYQSLRQKTTERQSVLEKSAEILEKVLDRKNYAQWFDLETSSMVLVTTKFRAKTREIIRELGNNNKIVIMSGTLAVNNSFDSVAYGWGGKPYLSEEVQLGTVFDYPKQAVVYVPEQIPRPVSTISLQFDAYCEELGKEILRLLKITGGRSLILCTSHKQLDRLFGILRPFLDELGITFLKQGDKSIELLSADFKQNETSVLIGTGSFFAGLSVPGKSLVSVILCKLPFPPPDDPFLDLIAEGTSKSERVELVDYPRMIIRLLQAGGRLIRTIEDFGIFTVLDPRVFSSVYSEKLQSVFSDAGYRITRNINDVEDFVQARMRTSCFAKYPEYKREAIPVPSTLLVDDKSRFVKTQPQAIDSFASSLEKMIIFNQKEYYTTIRNLAGLPKKLLAKFKEPFDIYQHLVELNTKKGLDLNISEEFPFVSENQKELFISRMRRKTMKKGSKNNTYFLSTEELLKYK